MAGRAVVAAVAVLMIAWLGLMERDAALQARAAAFAAPPQAPGDVARAAESFRAARLLNPDTTPDIGLAFALRAAGDRAGARRTIAGVLEREPDNLTAWRVFLALTQTDEPGAAARAHAALRRLDPLNARR